jgi:hypothetical protein
VEIIFSSTSEKRVAKIGAVIVGQRVGNDRGLH